MGHLGDLLNAGLGHIKDGDFDAFKDGASQEVDRLKNQASREADRFRGDATQEADKIKARAAEIVANMELEKNGFNVADDDRNAWQLTGSLAENGYDWWWHSFTGYHVKTGEPKTFFIEFFTVNPELGEEEPVYGQLQENKDQDKKPSYVMVKCGAWGEDKLQLHRFFGWDQVKISDNAPFLVEADDCELSEISTKGYVKVTAAEAKAHPEWMSNAGTMSWDLRIDKQVAFNVGYGASKPMRDTDAFEMFWHVAGMKTAYEGTVTYRGKKYEVRPEDCYGYADKNWGKDFTSPWIWLTSNNMTSKVTGEKLEDSVFVIGGGRPKVGPVALDGKLLGGIWYEGTPYEFNFSKAWHLPKTRFRVVEGKNKVTWKIIQETPTHKMYTSVECLKDDMIFVNYEAPDGVKRYNKLFNGGTGTGEIQLYKKSIANGGIDWELVDDIEIKNCGCEWGEYDKEFTDQDL